ncbi:fatty acid cis/trans isomerase [Vibrio chagasii]|nr:fatty acid cis/trans isomerase [Vibrio chagasii]
MSTCSYHRSFVRTADTFLLDRSFCYTSGEPVKRITTRRPYDDQKVPRVYYRLILGKAQLSTKTHVPFALNEERLQSWNLGFVDADYTVR